MYVAKRGTLNVGMRMEYLMARLMVPTIQAIAKDPRSVKMKDYLRFHETDDVLESEMTGADFAKMYGAVRKPNG